jgi:hypothetical protein
MGKIISCTVQIPRGLLLRYLFHDMYFIGECQTLGSRN